MLSLPAGFTPLILIHTGAAFVALLLGFAVFLRRKGTAGHRRLGRVWALLMLVVILSSFGIRGSGSFSWLHGLSVGSLVALVLAIYHARQGNWRAHRGTMIGLFVGGLIIAGFFTLLPSRLLGELVWHTVLG